MKYVSIDIETSGLDPENCQILSFGAIVEDTENILPYEDLPKFYSIIPSSKITGEPFALNMNKGLIEAINLYSLSKNDSDKKELEAKYGCLFLMEHDIVRKFRVFLNDHEFNLGKFNVAGKNFTGFDLKFLEQLPDWGRLVKLNRRALDPAILFADFTSDKELPNLTVCKERAGVSGVVTHNALQDAWDVIQVLRTKY